MILSISELDIKISYDEDIGLFPGQDPELTPPNITCHIVAAITITKAMIPEILYISTLEHFSPEGKTLYILHLNSSIRIESEDQILLEKLMKVLSSDFEGLVLREKHPELFL